MSWRATIRRMPRGRRNEVKIVQHVFAGITTSTLYDGAQSDFRFASALWPESVSSDPHVVEVSDKENWALAENPWGLAIGAPRQLTVVSPATHVAFEMHHWLHFTPIGITAWETGIAIDSVRKPK